MKRNMTAWTDMTELLYIYYKYTKGSRLFSGNNNRKNSLKKQTIALDVGV